MTPSSFPGELHGVDAERRDGEPAADPPRAQSPAARPARCQGAAPRPALARMTRPAHAVASPRVVNIEDLRRLARRRHPKVVFEYVDGGAEGEITLRENRRAFDAVSFRPRHAVGSPEGDLRTTVLDTELALPVLLAPVGYSRLMHPVGEPGAARAAGAAGSVYILSTMSGYKLEDVKTSSSGPMWYQLYLVGGRGVAEAAIERARVAGFSALVVTVDTAVAGMRARGFRNGRDQVLRDTPVAQMPVFPPVFVRPARVTTVL